MKLTNESVLFTLGAEQRRGSGHWAGHSSEMRDYYKYLKKRLWGDRTSTRQDVLILADKSL